SPHSATSSPPCPPPCALYSATSCLGSPSTNCRPSALSAPAPSSKGLPKPFPKPFPKGSRNPSRNPSRKGPPTLFTSPFPTPPPTTEGATVNPCPPKPQNSRSTNSNRPRWKGSRKGSRKGSGKGSRKGPV